MTAKMLLLFLRGFESNVEVAGAGFIVTYSHCIPHYLSTFQH